MKKQYLVLMCLTVAFFSCKKDELPVPKHDPGNVITQTVNMNADYKYQFYFDLETNTVVGQNLKTVWDIAFETSASGFHVILNTSKVMFAYNTGNTSFAAVTDTSGYDANKRWDEPSGHLDSTAIGNWQTNTPVYIIDRGYSPTGAHQGFRKIQFLSVTPTSYTLRFSQINGTGDTTLLVAKDSTYNFAYLSFATSSTIMVEPPKDSWDLLFTQYTHIFYEPEAMPYTVTGCLLNRYQTSAAKDSVTIFSQINYEFASALTLSTDINVIGYDWKYFTGSTYITNTLYNYIIKNRKGKYYKLHFIDFYNNVGEKGNPTWEYQQL